MCSVPWRKAGRETEGQGSKKGEYKRRLSRHTAEGSLRDRLGIINLQANFLSKCGLASTLNQILWGWDPIMFIVKAALPPWFWWTLMFSQFNLGLASIGALANWMSTFPKWVFSMLYVLILPTSQCVPSIIAPTYPFYFPAIFSDLTWWACKPQTDLSILRIRPRNKNLKEKKFLKILCNHSFLHRGI